VAKKLKINLLTHFEKRKEKPTNIVAYHYCGSSRQARQLTNKIRKFTPFRRYMKSMVD